MMRDLRNDFRVGRTMDHIQFKANQTAAGYVADGLDEIGLALTVRSAEDRDTWLKRHVDVRVGPEIGQCQPSEMHGNEVSRYGRRWRFLPSRASQPNGWA